VELGFGEVGVREAGVEARGEFSAVEFVQGREIGFV